MATDNDKRVETTGDRASGRDPNASSLIAMLIAGLILITVGAIVVMMFV